MPTFDKSGRLRKRWEFPRLSSSGNRQMAAHFVVISSDPVFSWARLGITVSKKVGNEFFRNNRILFPVADYNIIARSGASHLDYSAVCQELANALSRIGRKISH